MPAVDRQNQLQTQDVANRAAIFSNAQSRATIAYQQISFQREAAIQQEISRRTLYAQLFGGIGFVGGAFAASALYNAKHPSPSEQKISAGTDLPTYEEPRLRHQLTQGAADQFAPRMPGGGYESLRGVQFQPWGGGNNEW